MPLFVLDKRLYFPPAHLADPDGLLAIGGDLSPERLLLAYKNGIFPWYEGEHILWWSPDPRFVLFPAILFLNLPKPGKQFLELRQLCSKIKFYEQTTFKSNYTGKRKQLDFAGCKLLALIRSRIVAQLHSFG